METTSGMPTGSIDNLRVRAEILQRIRAFFDALGFIEVQTPVISSETMIDEAIDPVAVTAVSLGLGARFGVDEFYLQSSPEFCMKRLLVAGATAIYQIGPAFRAGEYGNWHNPEFTMLEWYRRGDTFQDGIDLLERFVKQVIGAASCQRITYQTAMIQNAGVDPLAASISQLQRVAQASGGPFSENSFTNRDDLLNLIFDAAVVPNLGANEPTILTRYPQSQAALAQVCTDDPRVAERFELFVDGVELGNGYGELLDTDELLARCERNNAARTAQGKGELPMPQRLPEAMRSGLPACSGCALGVDRLVAVMLGISSLSDVIAFPIDRA